MNFDRYIPAGHKPHARPVSEVYAAAMEELALPFPAIPFGRFPKLTKMTGGIRLHEYTILCGGTGTGKTTLCANLSQDLTDQRVPHFVASVETGDTDFVKRTMCSFVREDWNTGEAVPIDRLKNFHTRFGDRYQGDHMWLSLYDNRIPVESIMADVAYMVKHHGIKVAIIDNLNFLMEVKFDAQQNAEIDRVTHELIMFCKHVPVHLIMIMHPKKTDGARVESELDIKGSSTAVQEAHNVLLFNRPHPDLIKAGIATEFDRELKIAKMRRRGKYVGRRLILKGIDGTTYEEAAIV